MMKHRRRPFIAFVVLSAVLSLVACKDKDKPGIPSASNAGPVDHIDAQERLEAAKLVQGSDAIMDEIKLFHAKVRGAFDEKRFDELDAQAEELRSSSALFDDGCWKISEFYYALADRYGNDEASWQADLQLYNDWIAQNPESLTAHIALADFFVDYAWDARGNGYADTVTDRGWKLFGERLETSRDILRKARALPGDDPYWFSVGLTVGLGQGWSKKNFDAVLSDAKKQFPTYWRHDTQRAYSLLPRWYGEPGDWEAYAAWAADRTDGLGDEVYARIVINQMTFYGNVFSESNASWPRTKAGLEILREKYPDSLALVSYSARLATLGRDQELAKAMFDQLGDTYIKGCWGKPERMVHYRTWAQTGQW